MRKSFILALVLFLSVALASAADESTEKTLASRGAAKSSYVMLSGSVSKVEAADPSKIMIEVKNERDGELHTVEIAPTTSITKVTDISELKAGDSIRIMAKKIDDKEVAVGIMFGNLKKLSAQKEPAAAIKEIPKE